MAICNRCGDNRLLPECILGKCESRFCRHGMISYFSGGCNCKEGDDKSLEEKEGELQLGDRIDMHHLCKHEEKKGE